jgi:hypothetical protein
MGSLKAASLAGMAMTRHGSEIDGKQGDITSILLLGRDAAPDVALDPDIVAALAPPLVGNALAPPLPAGNSFFARCARRIGKFAERQSRRAKEAQN